MRSSHAIANWLFERLDLDVALTGDLLEERQRGRSAIWYWRQVLVAVWIAIWAAIRDHKLLTLRAVATGFATEFIFIFLWYRYVPDLRPFSLLQWITQAMAVLLTQTVTGWTVARTHRSHQVPMVFAFLVCFLFGYVYGNFSWISMVFAGFIDDPRARPYLVMFLMTSFLTAAGILTGGLIACPRKARNKTGSVTG